MTNISNEIFFKQNTIQEIIKVGWFKKFTCFALRID